MNRLRAWISMLALVGCARTATYGYQYRIDQAFAGNEDPEPAPVEARRLLADARTVAFFPPDRCVNTTDRAASEKEFRANCGVLLSLLERAAERAGYEVVSWVNLRGSNRPIDYAREARVDVLFEINEVAADEVKDVDVQRTLTFFDRDHDGVDTPLSVSTGVAERCRSWSKRDAPVSAGYSSTIDIKTVSVIDGRARWHYRKTLSQPSGAASPKVRFVGKTIPNKAASMLAGVGLGVAIAGAVFLFVDSTVNSGDDPMTGLPKEKVFGDAPWYMIVPGAIVGAAGLGLMAMTGQTKPSTDAVLCLETTVPSNGAYDTLAVVTHAPTMSSEHTFSEHRRGGDPGAKQKEKLIGDMIADFVTLLGEVKTTTARPSRAAQPLPAAQPDPAPVP